MTLDTAEAIDTEIEALERALEDGELAPTDDWLERLMAPFALDFVLELTGAQRALLQTAGRCLLTLEHPASADRLLERLELGVLRHDGDLYALYLIGRLGSPEHVPAVSAWFQGRPSRSISRPGFPMHTMMRDLLVRLRSDDVVTHIRQVITDCEAGELHLTKHHRWTYDDALAVLTDGAPHRWQPPPIADPE